MDPAFKNYLLNECDIADTDVERIYKSAAVRKLGRNEFLLEAGGVCRHKVFVVSGLLKTYSLTADGNEHILQFAPEHTWTLDAESYHKATPSRYNIETVESSEILMWAKPVFDELLLNVPALKHFSERIISETMNTTRERLNTLLSAGPEEKYNDFLEKSPHLLSRLPLKMIAAYLGMSLKTLNRVRQSHLQRI